VKEGEITGHAVRMAEIRYAYKIAVEKPDEIDDLGNIGVDGSIILKCVLNRV
jgi:hypothetical protein